MLGTTYTNMQDIFNNLIFKFFETVNFKISFKNCINR